MTSRADYTASQWEALVEAPAAIAAAVSVVAGTRRDAEGERRAFAVFVERSRASTPEDQPELLTGIVDAVHERLAADEAGWFDSDALVDGVQAARRAGAILAVRADLEEAAAVRGWLLAVARSVAAASREGGVLGLGSQRVSAPEEELLDQVFTALGGSEG